MSNYYGPYGLSLNELYRAGSKKRRITGNSSLMNLHNAIEAWVNKKYPEISARSVNRGHYNNNIQKWTNAIGRSLKPKTNYKTNYLYRGIGRYPGNITNTSGFSSWSNNLDVAQRFAGISGTILRVNTKKLVNVPVLWLGGQESEYILPPMKIIMNINSYNKNGRILPVTDIFVNTRFK